MFANTEELERQRAEGQPPLFMPPSKQTMVDWIITAWLELTQKIDAVKKSFLVTGISNALGGHEDKVPTS
jgi:hypothetical protein